jgi:short-subunit dehydrogenase
MAPALNGTYSSSKAAVVAMTDVLRIELRPTGVSVLEVVPGPVETAMLEASRQAAFVDLVLRVLPPGSSHGMAESIIRALERDRRRVSYPWHTQAPVLMPGLGKWFMRTVASRSRSRY